MKTYILQQDIKSPHRNIKKGSEFIRYCESNPDSAYMFDGYALDKSYIENNPEWFKLKEELSGLIGVSIKGNVVNYYNTASIKLDEKGMPTAIAINGKIFLPMN